MTAKYKLIVNILEEEIRKGLYNDSKKLPSEEELGKRFDVSRNTIRKALQTLVNMGLIYQVRGSGAYIRERALQGYFNLASSRGLTTDFSKDKVESKVLDIKLLECDSELAEKMKCEVGQPVYYVARLRVIDGVPRHIEYSYFNKRLIPYLSKEIAEKSIYAYIRNDLNLEIGIVDKILYAGTLTDEEAEILKVPVGSPTIVNENIAFLGNGEIFEVGKVVYNHEYTKFMVLSNLKE